MNGCFTFSPALLVATDVSDGVQRRMFALISGGLIAIASILLAPVVSLAQFDEPPPNDGGDSIASLNQEGRHYEAVLRFAQNGESAAPIQQLAAARSAWALGLPDRARGIWKSLLEDRSLSLQERTRIRLGQAIVELQEHRPREARQIAELGAREIHSSDLRAQLWLVVGESYREEKQWTSAIPNYERALEEGSNRTRGEAHYLLGLSSLNAKDYDNARKHFTAVESSSPYAPQSLRQLTLVELQQERYEGALMWINEGRDVYPNEFSDAWTGYATVRALTALTRLSEATEELKNLRLNHTTMNTWTTLAEAQLESALLQQKPKAVFRISTTSENDESRAQLSVTSAQEGGR